MRQYAFAEQAKGLGRSEGQLIILDEDQGKSGATPQARSGFSRLVGAVARGEVGIVMSLEVSRLSRNDVDWHHLVFGVNHHPEIVDRSRQMMILKQKRERGEVSDSWFEERALILTQTYPDEDSDRRLQVTSDYTLLAPLRFHLYRQVRQRAEALGMRVDLHEDRILEGMDGAGLGPVGRLAGC